MSARPALRESERKVLALIDVDAIARFVREFIEIPTLGGDEATGQDYVAATMRGIGLKVDAWDFAVSDLRGHPAFSMEVERDHGTGVVGRMGQGKGRTLILNGHVDVVPPGDDALWNHPPWKATVRGGQIFGRGAADMKGGLACALFAAKAIHDSGTRLRGTLLVESVIGEEDGGVGTLAASLRGYRGDGAIVLEPTDLKVAPAQAGALSFRITVPGASAHASVREEGVSAIEKFLPIYEALRELERRKNRGRSDPLFRRYKLPYALNIGTVRAGVWPSSVAESLVCEGRYGIGTRETVPAARRAFASAVRAAARRDPWLRRHPPRIEWWGGQFAPARIPTNHPITRTLRDAFLGANGRSIELAGMPYGSDMRLLVHVAKTPTVLFGPGDVRRAHRPDEFVRVEDLMTATRAVALGAVRFCGIEM